MYRKHLDDTLQELKLAVTDITGTNGEIRIRNIAVVAFILNGGILEEGEDFILNLELMKSAAATVLAAASLAVDAAGAGEVCRRIGKIILLSGNSQHMQGD